MKTQIWAIVLFLTNYGVTRPKEICWSIPQNQITQINKDLIFSNLQSSTQTTKIPHFIFFFFSPILWFLSFVQIWRSKHRTTTIRSKPTSTVIAWRPDLGCNCTGFAIWVAGLVLVAGSNLYKKISGLLVRTHWTQKIWVLILMHME